MVSPHFIVMIVSLQLSLESIAIKLPTYIKPCVIEDISFNRCATESARSALPQLIHGDQKLGLPSLAPLKIPEVSLLSNNDLSLVMKNLTVYGLENTEIVDFRINATSRRVIYKSFNKELDVEAECNLNGRLLFFPIRGSGPCKLIFLNGSYQYEFVYEAERRKNGKKYGRINNALSTFKFTLQKSRFDVEKLFQSDNVLGEQASRILNENWEVITEEMKPSVEKTLVHIAGGIAGVFFKRIPLDDFILHSPVVLNGRQFRLAYQ